jgi:hypothetical protein
VNGTRRFRENSANSRRFALGSGHITKRGPKEAHVAERDKGTQCGTAWGPQVTLPVIGLRLGLPRPERLAWYAGLGLMAAFELVDWELALIIGVGHLIADNVHNQTIAELASGAESGA